VVEQPPSDFDGAWKNALEQYFPDFLALFFSQAYSAIDWMQPVAFLDTELQQLTPEDEQGKQWVDKLVQVVRHDGKPIWVLVHVEVQSQRDQHFAERMLRYHTRIFDGMRQPVVSLAVLGDEEANWRPTGFGYELWGCELQFKFPMVKLRELDLTELETMRNPFATLTLMHRDAQVTRGKPLLRLQQKIARYRALLRQGYRADDIRMLLRLMEHLLRLNSELALVARNALRQVEQEELGMATFVTSFEEIGRAEGRAEGQRELVGRLLERKVGPLDVAMQQQVATLTPTQLLALSEALLDFTTLEELQAWIEQHSQ
jgi:hypothetical protein